MTGDDDASGEDAAWLETLLARPLPRSDAKVQRWIDLLAALLVRRTPATFAELAPHVPAYHEPGRRDDAVARMFERDKDELRRAGIPIETVLAPGEEHAAYRLPPERFYLPYLVLAARSAAPAPPARPGAYGYRALGTVAFAPDELHALAHAVERVRALGDPVLAAEAEWGARKLALELPMPSPGHGPDAVERVVPGSHPDAEVFERLGDALARRKRCTFAYHSMQRDVVAAREVEPYGLFFLSGHWYLAARDPALDGVRNFRLSRMRGVRVNAERSQTADYVIPPAFRLREHAVARHAWELGDGSEVAAEVDVLAWTGATRAAAALGAAADATAARRTFRVRRLAPFARWLLSFGGDLRPVSPPMLVDEYRRMVAATRARYDAPGREGPA